MPKQINLSENLERLNEIATWFDQQSHADVEEGLKRVKEAAGLIKESKERLKQIENEFVEIQSMIAEDMQEEDSVSQVVITQTEEVTEKKEDNEIPF